MAAAVIGGLLGGAPGASAAPVDHGGPGTAAPDRDSAGGVPPVWPRPQSLRARGGAVAVGDEATLIADGDADPYALDALRSLLYDAGVRTVYEATPGGRNPARGLVVHAGGHGAQSALRALRAPERGDLPSGGYLLATGSVDGRPTAALSGVGPDGLFHAVQTLRQLLVERRGQDGKAFAGVAVRDWPGTAVRGTTEGFYGSPWSRADRLAQLDFMGRTKQNRYLYAPGDDPYRQSRWRDPYPAAQREEFRELATRARANHVTLGWAVSPGQQMCFSSSDDLKALLRKVDAMWALGVRAFQLQFQDVSYSEWHCGKDSDTFGSGPEAAAKAQATVANAVARHLAGRHPGAVPLSLMPTEYYQDGDTAFRRALASGLDDRVEVAWTGVGVVPRTITGGELAGARSAFGHRLVTMDNYPVNDYAQDRIFLGPYTGRDPAVATQSAGLLANAMEQPTASRIPLFTAADFAWNPRGYRPKESWSAAIDDLAGPDAKNRAALRAFAGNDASSVLGGDESAYLRPLITAFWSALGDTDVGRLERASDRLRDAFRTMRDAPDRLAKKLGGDVRPWLDQLGRYGDAGVRAVDMLTAQARGDGAAAWKARLAVEGLRTKIADSRVTVGKGVLDPFLRKAVGHADSWLGVDRAGSEEGLRTSGGDRAAADGKVTTTVDAPSRPVTVRFGRTRPLTSVSALTAPVAGGSPGTVEAHVPGEGWRTLGALSRSGSTQAAGEDIRADAIRLSWAAGTTAPDVHELTPWFADTPAAKLRLSHQAADAEIGGRPAVVEAELTSLRPGDVSDDLTLRPPRGITVRAPEGVTAPRGGTATARLEISVAKGTKAGSYTVPVRFGSEKRTLTVRAFPRTGGPDLARADGAKATSSGDETPDFPASAAVDGKAETRWSSPAKDDAWLQLELARPARVGRLALRWQDAYARRYRVQVSEDGRTWRTAATVDHGEGGRESVGLDAPDTRFIRIQGVERATRFGYSLWSVSAYAVDDDR
ncbi:beta-N-acetylglucosaminidase domain-containing protein [Streptomyces sp. NA02950]|uniref:beta-N-acetylglucosaminidase domain-containing protein n=1 Tax=Streptomyces sp. NA02950 TaxID=2742137 RepID=UPI00158FCC5A|nr:beta-N-acetylglucosaminidase domain-containing protein [Streptomyces sp. NA02950]QKV94952.1 beta-N-acetylglucosaminidase domain-containing protein [Streptomyces sp. NA02950]